MLTLSILNMASLDEIKHTFFDKISHSRPAY